MHATLNAEPDRPIKSNNIGPNLYISTGENFVLVRFPVHMAAHAAMIAAIINSDNPPVGSPVANLASFYGEAVARSVDIKDGGGETIITSLESDPNKYPISASPSMAIALTLASELDIDGAAQDAVERRDIGS